VSLVSQYFPDIRPDEAAILLDELINSREDQLPGERWLINDRAASGVKILKVLLLLE